MTYRPAILWPPTRSSSICISIKIPPLFLINVFHLCIFQFLTPRVTRVFHPGQPPQAKPAASFIPSEFISYILYNHCPNHSKAFYQLYHSFFSHTNSLRLPHSIHPGYSAHILCTVSISIESSLCFSCFLVLQVFSSHVTFGTITHSYSSSQHLNLQFWHSTPFS